MLIYLYLRMSMKKVRRICSRVSRTVYFPEQHQLTRLSFETYFLKVRIYSHEKCPSCKGKVWFLSLSPMLISQLTGALSRNAVSRPQNSKSSKASGDTNSEQDICIPAISEKVVTLEPVNPNKHTNSNLFQSHFAIGYNKFNSCTSTIMSAYFTREANRTIS